MPDWAGNERVLETPSRPETGPATPTGAAAPAEDRHGRHILVAVGEHSQLSPLLTLACMLTHAGEGTATLLCVTPDGARPDCCKCLTTAWGRTRNAGAAC